MGASLPPAPFPPVGVSLNSTAAATANTTAIQNALNAGGLVRILGVGIIWINATLVIGSNTELDVGPGITIKQVAGTNKTMLVTNGYNTRATTASVTLAWTSGPTVTATWTAHTLAVGDYAWISGASPSAFNGIVKVATVVDADHFTYTALRTPTTSATGTIVGKKADVNIAIRGGIWDYNYPNNSATGTLNAMMMQLGGAQNLCIADVVVQKAEKFCICIGASRDVIVANVTAPTTNSDIVKAYGPVAGGKFRNISGLCGDDGITLQTKEAAAFSYAGWTFGDIINCQIDGVDIEQTGTETGIVVLYPSDTEYMGGITIKNVGGYTAFSAVAVNAGYAGSILDDVLVENINAVCLAAFTATAGSTFDLTAHSVELRDIVFNPATITTSNGIVTSSSAVIKKLTIDGVTVNSTIWPSGVGTLISIAGQADEINVFNASLHGVTSLVRLMNLAAGVNPKIVNIRNVTDLNGENFLVLASGMGVAPVINISGCDISALAVVNASSSCRVALFGNRISGATNGVLRTTGTVTIDFTAYGNYLASGSWIVTPSGTPIINVRSFEVQVDLSATGITRTTGNYAYNTNAALGTLGAAGPVVCQGTAANSWCLQANPTLQY